MGNSEHRSYLLGLEDLHYENLIVHGEFPVIIDLEMGIGSRGYKRKDAIWTETEHIFYESVIQTGLLPMYTWKQVGEGINVGAINGTGGQLLPILLSMVVHTGTVYMHIEYGQPVTKEAKNLATFNGKFVKPYEFRKEIKKGIESAYRFIIY